MSVYCIRLARPTERASRADVATAVALASDAIVRDVQPGPYLVSSDPNARGGRGREKWSDDPAKAKRFATHEAARACWMAQSTRVPFRPDGKPNRPMTAYSITIEPFEGV